MKTTSQAYFLANMIEQQASPDEILAAAQLVIRDLGGNPSLVGTSPGATALYVLALMLKP